MDAFQHALQACLVEIRYQTGHLAFGFNGQTFEDAPYGVVQPMGYADFIATHRRGLPSEWCLFPRTSAAGMHRGDYFMAIDRKGASSSRGVGGHCPSCGMVMPRAGCGVRNVIAQDDVTYDFGDQSITKMAGFLRQPLIEGQVYWPGLKWRKSNLSISAIMNKLIEAPVDGLWSSGDQSPACCGLTSRGGGHRQSPRNSLEPVDVFGRDGLLRPKRR